MENLFNSILSMSVDGAWLIVAVMVARFLLHKAPKYFRKILWVLVGIRLVIPFSFESVFSLMPEKVNDATQTVSQGVADTLTQQQTFSFIDVLPYIWAVVASLLIVYGIISFVKLKYKIFDAVIYKDNIYLSEKAESPFVYGFIKPKIYIPYNLDDKTRECILQHENTHIKYADHILKIVGFAILCIHWFNPLVWVSYFLFCKDIELSCDESVIKKYDKDGCKDYAKALLDIGVNRVRFSACPIAFGEVSIKERINNTLNYKKAGRVFVCFSVLLCVGVAVCFMTKPEAQAKENVQSEVRNPESVTEVVTEKETEKPTEKESEPITEEVTENITENIQKQPAPVDTQTPQFTQPHTKPDVVIPQIQNDDDHFEYVEDDKDDEDFELNSGVNDFNHFPVPIGSGSGNSQQINESVHVPNNIDWGEYGTNSLE